VLSRSALRAEEGFMLVELLTGAVILTIVVAMFSQLMVSLVTRNGAVTNQAVLSSEARPALDAMSNELRGAMCNNTTQPITAANATSITFTTPDRAQPYHLLQITYSLSGGTLTRQVTKSTNTGGPPWTMGSAGPVMKVAQSVTNSVVFHYYDSSGTDLSPTNIALTSGQLPNVAQVSATLTVAPAASHGADRLTAQRASSMRSPTCS
jgi:type II secretory pathway component PulJ